jgi:hypothetical protein
MSCRDNPEFIIQQDTWYGVQIDMILRSVRFGRSCYDYIRTVLLILKEFT